MPKLFLAIDNCFAAKRWTLPQEWAQRVADLGLTQIEASADTENDPLYQGREYQKRWVPEVNRACREHGVRVANLYSGHGTYSTLGLGHTDPAVAERMLNEWLLAQIDTAAQLEAGLGFYVHAFPLHVIEDAKEFAAARSALIDRLAVGAKHAAERMSRPFGIEQMYTPHQIPWTIEGTKSLLSDIAAAGAPTYITIDVGHQSGQARFQLPDESTFAVAVEYFAARTRDGHATGRTLPWVGNEQVYALARAAAAGDLSTKEAWNEALAIIDSLPHLFAEPADGDPYAWLESLGAYSPIIHLQQTDGNRSAHLPFTKEQNEVGIITGERLLRAIGESYARTALPESTPPAEELYLTIEVFLSTASNPYQAFEEIRETVAYWRQFVPTDGIPLEQAIAALTGEVNV